MDEKKLEKCNKLKNELINVNIYHRLLLVNFSKDYAMSIDKEIVGREVYNEIFAIVSKALAKKGIGLRTEFSGM